MSTARLKRLATVAHLQSLRKKRTEAALAAARENYQHQLGLRLQLQRYSEDYTQLNAANSVPRSPAVLRNSSQFVAELAVSIDRQLAAEAQAKQALDGIRQRWQSEAARLDALESLVLRARSTHLRELAHSADIEAADIWQATSQSQGRKRS